METQTLDWCQDIRHLDRVMNETIRKVIGVAESQAKKGQVGSRKGTKII